MTISCKTYLCFFIFVVYANPENISKTKIIQIYGILRYEISYTLTFGILVYTNDLRGK